MKKLLVLLSIFAAVSANAASVDCKIEAHIAAGELYTQENPGSAFFVRTKFKPVREDKVIFQVVELIDRDRVGMVTQMTVTLNAKTCSVLSID